MSVSSNAQLLLAIIGGHRNVVAQMIKEGVDVNAANAQGATPLMIAALHGHHEIVALLLHRKVDINAIDSTRSSALMMAANAGHALVAVMLLEAGAKPDLQDGNGWAALMMAARKDFAEIVMALLDARADVNLVNIDGSAAILYAVGESHEESTLLLLEAHPQLNKPNKPGTFPLGLAAERGNVRIVRMLLDAGAAVNAANSANGMTALHMAAQFGSVGVVELLLERGASVSARNIDGATPIMYAQSRGHLEVARMLMGGITGTDDEIQSAASDQVAQQIASRILDDEEDDLSTLLTRGEARSQRGEWKQALVDLEKAAQIRPDVAQLWHNIGLLYTNLKIADRAIEAYDRALQLDRSLWQTWNNKGEELRVLERYDEALVCFDEALKLNPHDEKSIANRKRVPALAERKGQRRECGRCGSADLAGFACRHCGHVEWSIAVVGLVAAGILAAGYFWRPDFAPGMGRSAFVVANWVIRIVAVLVLIPVVHGAALALHSRIFRRG